MRARCPKRDPLGDLPDAWLWLTMSLAQTGQTTAGNGVAAAGTCRENKAGIRLPPGFCVTVFADELSRAHL
jgi:hypothetical protein